MKEANEMLPALPPITGSNVSPYWLGMRRVLGRDGWMAPCGTVVPAAEFARCRTMLEVVEVLTAAGLKPPDRAYMEMVRTDSQAEDLQARWAADRHKEEVAVLEGRAEMAEQAFLKRGEPMFRGEKPKRTRSLWRGVQVRCDGQMRTVRTRQERAAFHALIWRWLDRLAGVVATAAWCGAMLWR